MATPEYFGTDSADTVTRDKVAPGTFWAHYWGKGGDDIITWSNGQALGGAGNDTITRAAGDTSTVYASYWDSPAGIYVDLDAGYALDGWGTRDKLVNIHNIGDSGQNDTIYGSSGDDLFGVDWGQNYVDGRGGTDTVEMEGPSGKWTFQVSPDGRTVIAARIDNPTGRTSELHNIEKLHFWDTGEDLLVSDLADKSQLGPQALVESPAIRWNAAQPGSAVTVTYSFANSVPKYGNGNGGTGSQAWTDAQKAAVSSALSAISAETQLTFNEVADTDSAYGQIRLGINQQASGKAYSYLPDTALGDLAGDIWLNASTAANLSKGGAGWNTLLHEIGHALGLKHPLDSSYTGSLTIIPSEENDTRYTVMSGTDVMNGAPRDGMGMYDLSALRSLYGSRSVGTGNDKYAFADIAGRTQTLIVDDGGSNAIDASATSVGARIDLRCGKLSSIGRDAQDQAAVDNVGIAFGTTIASATGTNLDDMLTGNDADNTLTGLDGNDVIDGGGGTDTAVYAGNRADYSVSVSAFSGSLIVSAVNGTEGTDTLTGVERLRFADGMFDVKGGATVNASGIAVGDAAVVRGSAGNDAMTAGTGASLFDGGDGVDTVAFSGNRSTYRVMKSGNGYTVADAGGVNVKATLNNVEKLQFADATVSIDYNEAVQSLYVAYFGRAADSGGLANFEAQLVALGAPKDLPSISAAYASNSAIRSLVDAFGTSDESKALYTGGTSSFVTAIYNNVLNRGPDQEGLNFWVNAIDHGGLSRANASLSIMSGALSNTSVQGQADSTLVKNKIAVASNFTFAIDTPAETQAYSGNAAAATVRGLLSGVTAATDTNAFQATVESTLSSMGHASSHAMHADGLHDTGYAQLVAVQDAMHDQMF